MTAAANQYLTGLNRHEVHAIQYLDRLLNTAPIGVVVVDDEGGVRGWNQYATALLDRNERDAVGIRFKDLFTPDSSAILTQLFVAAGNGGRPYPAVLSRPLADGPLQFLEVTMTALSSRTGKPGTLILLQNVTARVRAEEEREHSRRILEQKQSDILALNERLKRSMTETHHRVKNNLQILSALIEMQTGNPQEMVPLSEFSRLGAHGRALSVIHDLLTQEAKKGSVHEVVSAGAVLEKLLFMLQQSLGDHRLSYQCEDVRLVVRQATSLVLIANELIANARKHGKGQIEVVFSVSATNVILEVCDDGPGFPEDFDARQAANTGLELVENITRWDLQGRLSYASRTGGGGKVTLLFPINQ